MCATSAIWVLAESGKAAARCWRPPSFGACEAFRSYARAGSGSRSDGQDDGNGGTRNEARHIISQRALSIQGTKSTRGCRQRGLSSNRSGQGSRRGGSLQRLSSRSRRLELRGCGLSRLPRRSAWFSSKHPNSVVNVRHLSPFAHQVQQCALPPVGR